MGRKPIERKYIKSNDGRQNNGRKKGQKNTPIEATPRRLNKAKKERISLYAINSMRSIFGSEKEAFESLAEKAKDGSFPHFKLLLEYAYGKPEDLVSGDIKKGTTFNIQNIFTGSQPKEDDTEETNFEIIEE